MTNFEAAANFDEWPPNEKGKATQVAVFGLDPDRAGVQYEILWTGKFPDLEKAMYWGAKKELEIIRQGVFPIASRVLWQHDLSPQQAVEAAYRKTKQQMDEALAAAKNGVDPNIAMGNTPNGPLHAVDYSKVEGFVFDIEYMDEDGGKKGK